MVSILLGVWNGGGVCCCCPAQCGGVAHALLIPLQYSSVLLSCRVLLPAGCVVWVRVRVCAVRVVGYPLSAPPSSWWWVGPSLKGGVCVVVGGMMMEGRGAVLLASPSNVGVPRLCVGVPLVVYLVALLNGGSGVCCDAPSSDWVLPLALSCPSCIASPLLTSPLLSSPLLPLLCSLSQHCWFRVVSL